MVWKPVEVKGERPDLALSGGGMFTSRNGKLYLYDGQKMGESKADDKSSLVSFDTRSQMFKTEATWAQDDGYTPFRYSRGAAVDIPELGLGIYVGGARLWEGAEASKKWYYPADHQMMTMSIGEQNWDRKWSRLAKDRKTIGASVTWLPVGGDKGILVVIGGTYERSERVCYLPIATLQLLTYLQTSGPGEDGDKIPSYSMMVRTPLYTQLVQC